MSNLGHGTGGGAGGKKELPKPPEEEEREEESKKSISGRERQRREERKAVVGVSETPEEQIQEAKDNIEAAKEAIKTAESYEESGGTVTWRGQTYDLSTTEGWKDYRGAIRDAKSEVRTAEREVKEYELAVIQGQAPTAYTTETVVTGTMYSIAPITPRKPWEAPDDPAPESEQYLDALGDVEREMGEKALGTIEEARPEAYRGYTKVQMEEAAESYEEFYAGAIEKAYKLGDMLTIQAEEAKIEDRDAEAGLKYAAGLAVSAYGHFLGGVTALARPYNIPRSIAAGAEIMTDAEKFQEILPKTKTEWLKAYTALPATLLGGKVASEAVNIARYKIKEADIKALAKEWSPEEQLIAEREMGFEYPEAVTVQRAATRGLEKAEDIGVLPYKEGEPYLLGRKMRFEELEIQDILLKKAYLQTGAGTEVILVPENVPLMPVYKPIADVEIAPSWMPGVKYVWGEASIPFKKVDLSALGISITPVSLDKISQRETQIIKEIEKQTEISLEKELPKPVSGETPIYREPQIQIPTPTIITRQRQVTQLEPTQKLIEEPVFEEPTGWTPEPTIIEETTRRPRVTVKTEPRKPSRKKKKGKKKSAYELRVDKPFEFKFKEPKVKL